MRLIDRQTHYSFGTVASVWDADFGRSECFSQTFYIGPSLANQRTCLAPSHQQPQLCVVDVAQRSVARILRVVDTTVLLGLFIVVYLAAVICIVVTIAVISDVFFGLINV